MTKNLNGKRKCWQHYVIYISKNKLTPHTFRMYRQRSMKRCSCKWNIERQAIVHFCLQHLSNEKQAALQQRLLLLLLLLLSPECRASSTFRYHTNLSGKKSPLGIIPTNTMIKKNKGTCLQLAHPKMERNTYSQSPTLFSHFSLCGRARVYAWAHKHLKLSVGGKQFQHWWIHILTDSRGQRLFHLQKNEMCC